MTMRKPDPSVFPLGSPKSRAAARHLLALRKCRPATPEDNAIWHQLKSAHARMRKHESPVCDEKKCSVCIADMPPPVVGNVDLDSLADAIRKARLSVVKKSDAEIVSSVLMSKFVGTMPQ